MEQSFFSRLVEKTKEGECFWEEMGTGSYRLILKKGGVVFEYGYDSMVENYHYSIKLYDTTENFASYSVDYEDNYDEGLFHVLNELRETIESRKKAIIDAKIKLLYDELA